MEEQKFSIITPSYNQGSFIERTIYSVLDQNYQNFEHIIVDGVSTDNTLDILKNHDHLKWMSEEDSGQSQAINKGFRLASGDIIGWLNSDDVYLPDTFRKVNEYFIKNPGVDLVFSHCPVINENDKLIGYFTARDPRKVPIATNHNYISQPTVFFRRIIFDTTGYLNEKYRYSMDFDYWRRIAKKHQARLIDDNFACFRKHSDSKTVQYAKRFRRESKDSFFNNGGSVFSPYYFETFIKRRLEKLLFKNSIIRKLFYKGK